MMLGKIAFLGSGETSAIGGKLFENLASLYSPPVHIAVLETPAGFELNAASVAGRVSVFLGKRLQNYQASVKQIPARNRDPETGTDSPVLAVELLRANITFLGPGSPTFTVRMLKDSLFEQTLRYVLTQGASIIFGSAAAIAAGKHALPVYEIYKVGEDLHWKPGMNFLYGFGLEATIIPHWNNTDGGSELDTSHCFMGASRFSTLENMLPSDEVIVGLDEHTACILDLNKKSLEVMGSGQVHLKSGGRWHDLEPGLYHFKNLQLDAVCDADIPVPESLQAFQKDLTVEVAEEPPPDQILSLAQARSEARKAKNWALADEIRHQMAALGWAVDDTPDGQQLRKIGKDK